MAGKDIWLSREGGLFGPFDQEDLERLKESGGYNRFTWEWNASTRTWTPINAPPLPPGASAPSPQPQAMQAPTESPTQMLVRTPAAAQQSYGLMPDPGPEPEPSRISSYATASQRTRTALVRTEEKELTNALQVICHDQRHIVSGRIREVLSDGFIMLSLDRLNEPAPFRKGVRVWVNLLDETRGETENIEARVASIKKSKNPDSWRYELRWISAPSIIR